MRVGQTAGIFFVSKVLASLIGFVAMVYFARALGSSVLGVYFLVIALVGWLVLINNFGLNRALNKRISEGTDRGQHIIAALTLYGAAFLVITLSLFLFRDLVNAYLGESLVLVVVLLVAVEILLKLIDSVMKGEQLVHANGLLSLTETIMRVALQVTAVVLGFALLGLFSGQIAASGLAATVGAVVTVVYFSRGYDLKRPTRKHYKSLIDYAKFSWLGDMKGKIYQRMDIIILGFFSPSSLIGIYSICWNIAQFLEIFSKSISTTMFPEISRLSGEDRTAMVDSHVEDALAYAGLFTIPGFVGAAVLGQGVLNIYGSEFQQGYPILLLLLGATLVHGYHKQMMNTLDAVNRPDITFWVNVFFAMANISLNVILVYLYGWIGAAVATFISIVAAMLVAFHMLSALLTFSIPREQILWQVLSAAVMGSLIAGLARGLESVGIDTVRVIPVFGLVGIGVLVYFGTLTLVSTEFRRVVADNSPEL